MAERVQIKEQSSEAGLITLLLLGGVGYFIYERFVKPGIVTPIKTAKYIERLQITQPRVRIELDKKRINISFRINNPNQTPMKLNSVVCQLWAGEPGKPNLHIGDVDYYKSEMIKPNNFTEVSLNVGLKSLNTIAFIVQILSGKMNNIQFSCRGTVNANDRPWPIDETLQLSA